MDWIDARWRQRRTDATEATCTRRVELDPEVVGRKAVPRKSEMPDGLERITDEARFELLLIQVFECGTQPTISMACGKLLLQF